MTNHKNRAERRHYAKVWNMPMAKGIQTVLKRDKFGKILATHKMVFKRFTEKRKGVKYLRIKSYIVKV